MLTSKLIDVIMSRAAASTTRAQALLFLNEVQNFVCARRTPISRVQPDPILKTVDGVLSYAASSSIVDDSGNPVGDVYTVSRVYREGGCVTSLYSRDERLFEGDQGSEVEIGVGVIPSKGPNLGDCKIVWPRHTPPKTTNGLWRCEVYLWPAQLDSEQIPLTVPADAHMTLLLQGVMEQIEMQEYGRGDWPSQKFMLALEAFDNKHSVDVIQPGVQTANQIPYRAC